MTLMPDQTNAIVHSNGLKSECKPLLPYHILCSYFTCHYKGLIKSQPLIYHKKSPKEDVYFRPIKTQ